MLTATWLVWLTVATVAGRPVLPADVPAAAWLPLIGVGVVSTAVAVQAFYAGARRIGAAQAALVSTVEPVYTITLATLLFLERLTVVQVVGGVLVIGAVLIAQTTPDRAEPVVRADP
jgi:drug/metabolite transporter (DMT)-like permease